MGVNNHVFGSNAERSAWKKLQQRWGDRYMLYPNLPFLMVLNGKNLVDISAWPRVASLSLTKQEFDWLKKTSIDFTLCDDTDKPLVCIEFDGMQEGFNVGTKYRAADPTNPWRDTIMSLKLKVAHGSRFPYFVVGSEQFRDISSTVKMCLIDAIIGSVLAGRAIEERAQQFDPEQIGMTHEAFDLLSLPDQDELVQAWFTGVEVEADVTFNPVFKAEYDLWKSLCRRLGTVQRRTRYAHQPSIDDGETPTRRASLIQNAILHGAACTVTTQQFGEITRTVWIPNFKVPGFSAYGFLDEMAELVALDAVRRLADAHT